MDQDRNASMADCPDIALARSGMQSTSPRVRQEEEIDLAASARSTVVSLLLDYEALPVRNENTW
jgi:hypothetical protein